MNTTRLTTAILGLCLGAAAIAQDTADDTGIPPQPLNKALEQFADQSGLQIIYVAELAEGKDTPGAKPNLSDTETLDQLLASTGLQYEFLNDNTVTVQAAADDAGGDSDPGNGRTAGATPRPVMMAQAVAKQGPSRRTETDSGEEDRKRPLEEIVVTGTLIPGVAPESSPIQYFDREDIIRSGASSTEDFIRREIPQNFGGGSSEYAIIGLPGNMNSGRNRSFGSSANLRGLGQKGTLVLLDGKRLAPSSEIGDFVDISMIPVSALDRVDVLTDGASSLYGGDAIAGVINFVLRDDFEGAETSLRYGTATKGDMDEYRANQTLGTAWEGGNFLATYEYYFRDRLTLSDRDNIPRFSAASDSVTLPELSRFNLLPQQQRHSAVVSAGQELSSKLSVDSTLLYSNRESSSSSFDWSSTVNTFEAESENIAASLGGEYEFSTNWLISLDGTYSEISSDNIVGVFRSDGRPDVNEKRETRSDLWAIEGLINGNLFELPAGPVKMALGGQYREESFSNERIGTLVSADGKREVSALYAEFLIPVVSSANSLPGAKEITLNLSGRIDDYSDFGTSSNPKIGGLWAITDGFRVRSSYSTSFAPPALGTAFDLSRLVGVVPFEFWIGLVGASVPDPSLAGTSMLIVQGVAADLDAETSQTFTFGFDWDGSQGNHSWEAAATYYDIEFENRLGTVPMPDGVSNIFASNLAWENPDVFPSGTITFFPSEELVASTLALSISSPVFFPNTDVNNIGVISTTALTRNLANIKTNGFDFRANYYYEAEFGTFSAGVNLNFIDEFTEQAASTTPSVPALNTLYRPVDLQARARMGIQKDAFSANVFANFVDSYSSDLIAGAAPINSWTTIDASLSYDFGLSSSWLNRTRINFQIQNLFDEDPPNTPTDGSGNLVGYDPANASPIGRFVSLELSKAF